MTGDIHPSARLLRGFAVDFLTGHNTAAVETIMEPDYTLSIGGHVFSGRDDAYLPATAAQLDQFPGLCVTVHDVVIGPDNVAMRFTEHGVSRRHGGRMSTWGGVTLFRVENGRLHRGWAEEDYFARKRQLATGVCDSVNTPHPAPWDAPCEPRDPDVEALARSWLADPRSWTDGARIDEISAQGPRLTDLVEIETISIGEMFSAGRRGAFHLQCQGTYRGGFDDMADARMGQPVALRMAGLLTVEDGEVSQVQVTADRLGLHRSLLDAR